MSSATTTTSAASTASALPMAKTQPRENKRSSTRYSILSDPRLSQLFALSSQLEALAQSISEETSAADHDPTSTASDGLEKNPPTSPPALPPKPPFNNIRPHQMSFQLNNNFPPPPTSPPPSLPPKLGLINNGNTISNVTNIKYERLEDEDNAGSEAATPSVNNSSAAPPPRYSITSDNSRMSLSSQGEGQDTTPSGHSLLSDSILLQVSSGGVAEEADTPNSDSLEVHVGTSQASPEKGRIDLDGVKAIKTEKVPETEAEWQARCLELELALQKFRDQAHNIRKLLRDKVRHRFQHFIPL